MVFRLFPRKSTLDNPATPETNANARLPTPTPSVASVSHRSPLQFPTVFRPSATESTLRASDLTTESVSAGGSTAPPPPATPSPAGPGEVEVLYNKVLTIPPKTLHAYTLAHLRPQPPPFNPSPSLVSLPEGAPRSPSPNTVSKLITFFSSLAPPPLLHCVRCHKDFYDIENEEKDKACRVPHDDDSALVSRVSSGGYETLWGCCGQTASGDGSEGPPDGWCYEGRHTTDIKRARFRSDSTIHDDKLTSCLKLNCHGIRDRLPRGEVRGSPSRNPGTSSARKSNTSPARSQASGLAPRSVRKRPRKSLKEPSSSDIEDDAESLVSRATKAKNKEKVAGRDEDTTMAVDELSKSKAKTRSRPISQAPPSAFTSVFRVTPAISPKAKTTTSKPKSTSRTLLSQSHTHLPSDSEASTRSRPRTRSQVREESRARDVSRSRTTAKLTRAGLDQRTRRGRKAAKPRSQTPSSEDEPVTEPQESEEERGRDRKKRRVGRH